MWRFIWEWIYAKQISRHRGALGVLGGQTFKSLGKLSNGWTDWRQLWFTSADLAENGITQGAFRGGGARGSHIQKYCVAVKLLHRFSQHLVHMWRFTWEWIYAKQISRHRGALGVLGGEPFNSRGKLSNGGTDCHQILVHVGGFVWEWT